MCFVLYPIIMQTARMRWCLLRFVSRNVCVYNAQSCVSTEFDQCSSSYRMVWMMAVEKTVIIGRSNNVVSVYLMYVSILLDMSLRKYQ